MRVRWGVGSVMLVLALASCHSTPSSQPSPSPPAPTVATPSPAPTPAGPSPSVSPSTAATCPTRTGAMPAGLLVLQQVGIADRGSTVAASFVFTSVGTAPAGPGSYSVGPVSPPFAQDGSGAPVTVTGSSFLRLRMMGAYGYDPANVPPKASYTGPLDLAGHVAPLAEARRTGDSEGVLTWVLGLSRGACPQVSTLASPPTLVVAVPK